MNKIEAALRLTRIEHSIMLAVAVIAAEIITKGLPGAQTLALSLITPVFISMGAFALNDYFDVEADTVNKMRRPLVVGALSRKEALALGVASLLIGGAASALINVPALAVAIIFAAISILYSYTLKDMPLVGNAMIALSMAIPFIYGDYVVSGTLKASLVLVSLLVFVSGLAREIHGMIRDYEGDAKARHTRNAVSKLGIRTASYVALMLYAVAVLISAYMFVYTAPFEYNAVYAVPILVIDLALLYLSIGYIGKPSRKFFDSARNISLGAMAASILVFLASALLYFPV